MTVTFAEFKALCECRSMVMWEQVCISAFGAVVLWILFAREINS
jgi:hypothetical protein